MNIESGIPSRYYFYRGVGFTLAFFLAFIGMGVWLNCCEDGAIHIMGAMFISAVVLGLLGGKLGATLEKATRTTIGGDTSAHNNSRDSDAGTMNEYGDLK